MNLTKLLKNILLAMTAAALVLLESPLADLLALAGLTGWLCCVAEPVGRK
jgi:energy-converting hydrogenase Eha subunit C